MKSSSTHKESRSRARSPDAGACPPARQQGRADQPEALAADALAPWLVPLPRVASLEQWLAGRAGRRKLCERFGGGYPLRRKAGSDPAKDAVLRQLHGGERGGRFATTAELEQSSARAQAILRRGSTGLPAGN